MLVVEFLKSYISTLKKCEGEKGMETVNVGDHVVIDCSENRFHSKGALVVSIPFDCKVGDSPTKVVAVKVFDRGWFFGGDGEWKEFFLILELSNLKADTKDAFEMSRLEVKFGHFWTVHFIKEDLNPDAECAYCQSSARVRIELNIWGSIYQYDVCRSCAVKWDGALTDSPPEKNVDTLSAEKAVAEV